MQKLIVHKTGVELVHKLMLEELLASFLWPIVIKKISYLINRWWLVCARFQAHFTFGCWNNTDIKPRGLVHTLQY